MESLIDTVVTAVKTYNWNNPFTFVIVILLALLILRKWAIFLIVLLTAVLGWGAQDLMITNIETSRGIISLPLIIYGVGGIIFVVLTLMSFYKS
ncbi:hypothetical protein LLG96_02010 [bacterium]|nr:hypothetical protein [bacterium]